MGNGSITVVSDEAGRFVRSASLFRGPGLDNLTPTGQGNVVKTEAITANSPKTFSMAEHSGINGRVAIMVTSKTPGKKVMVDRSFCSHSAHKLTDTGWYRKVPDGTKPPEFMYRTGLSGTERHWKARNPTVLKTVVGVSPPWVQIPPSPPEFRTVIALFRAGRHWYFIAGESHK